jgi:hypothetical protein
MHQCLRLVCPGIENGAGIPEELQDEGGGRGWWVTEPSDEACAAGKGFHADVLFDADGETVQQSDWFLVGRKVVVEVFGAGEGAGGEE